MKLIKEIKKHIVKNGLDDSQEEFLHILDFIKLHNDIKKIDKEAAKKLVGYINSENKRLVFAFDRRLAVVFYFSETDEGVEYWENIDDKLIQLRSSTKKEGK